MHTRARSVSTSSSPDHDPAGRPTWTPLGTTDHHAPPARRVQLARLARFTVHTVLVVCTSVSLAACGSSSMDARATREDCTKVAEHIADLVIADALANPDRLWESAKAAPDGGGVPATITQDQFKTWLDSPEGKTWMMARRGQTLASAQQGVEGCVAEGTRADTRCLLAAKTRADVLACDEASQKRRGSRPEASGSATGSGEPTTGSAAAGSAATGSAATGAAPTGSAATGSAATGSATGSAP